MEKKQPNSRDKYSPEFISRQFLKSIMRTKRIIGYKPLPNAENYTLTLKIQMKHITKPPMWREVEVPANYTFMQLHVIIQTVVDLYDSHLWQFGLEAYDDSLVIGIPYDGSDSWSPGVEDVTHDATDTYLTQFFQDKGDKLEYVYDFGDDWIFVVSCMSLSETACEYPRCTKFKNPLNAFEDLGGPYTYLYLRELLDEWDTTPKTKLKQIAENLGYKSADALRHFLEGKLIDIDRVNEDLKDV